MAGKIESGQLVTVVPADASNTFPGDIVLCKVNGKEYLHLVKQQAGVRFLIGNNRGRTNGWTSVIYGKVIKIEP
jgi:SOS-response transcriptional repressor LexA